MIRYQIFFFLRFLFYLEKILCIRFIKFISSNQEIVATQCKKHTLHAYGI